MCQHIIPSTLHGSHHNPFYEKSLNKGIDENQRRAGNHDQRVFHNVRQSLFELQSRNIGYAFNVHGVHNQNIPQDDLKWIKVIIVKEHQRVKIGIPLPHYAIQSSTASMEPDRGITNINSF